MILFVADQYADVHRDPHHAYPGGAELTDAAVIEAAPDSIVTRTFATMSDADIANASICVVGNAARASKAQVASLATHSKLILFEHDFRICNHRGDMTTRHHWLHNQFEWCTCRNRRTLALMQAARGVIFLTDYQRGFYSRNPWYRSRPYRVLGSSVFDKATIETWRDRDPTVDRRYEAAVSFSKHVSKGFAASLARAHEFTPDPLIIRDLPPREVLTALQESKRFIHTPLSPEWAGRLPVEARFMGCEVITNHRVGVTQEAWWKSPDADALHHVASAATRFWKLVGELTVA